MLSETQLHVCLSLPQSAKLLAQPGQLSFSSTYRVLERCNSLHCCRALERICIPCCSDGLALTAQLLYVRLERFNRGPKLALGTFFSRDRIVGVLNARFELFAFLDERPRFRAQCL